ncbi:MAG TPA: glycosyltransferase, partial [Polyangiaceae bacterium]|nr:glycosyltransferase [Polyangiaceae bacterium]
MIPGRAHLVWLGERLPWATVLAAASAAARGGFERVLFHHTDRIDREPHYAPLSRAPRVEARPLDPIALVEQAGGGKLVDCYRELTEPAARANVLRVALLREQGGVYVDADTVTLRSFSPLRAQGGFFCGEERLVFPATRAPFLISRLDPRALLRTTARDVCRRLPRGYRAFRRIERFYGTAPNNAVLGAEARHPFVEDLVGRMQALPKAERRVRYALGVHLLQRAVADWSGPGLHVERPEVFYPLGPEISEQWFRRYDAADANEVVSSETLLVHLYASVRIKESLG